MPALATQHALSEATFRQLAEFRHRIRQFVHFSEVTAREHGLEPQQHQLLLAIKGLPEGVKPTVRSLAERMCLRHHSTVELVNRLAERGAVVRRHSEDDRREVLLELTSLGEKLLSELSVLHWDELQVSGPALSQAIQQILEAARCASEAATGRLRR
ncbi:MAG: MarR family transcriptional regulator [Acidobacteriaceae bacterium]|nr:MarR family transcriptional regulator [Acidobacteriaceae bacterium]